MSPESTVTFRDSVTIPVNAEVVRTFFPTPSQPMDPRTGGSYPTKGDAGELRLLPGVGIQTYHTLPEFAVLTTYGIWGDPSGTRIVITAEYEAGTMTSEMLTASLSDPAFREHVHGMLVVWADKVAARVMSLQARNTIGLWTARTAIS